MKPSSIMNYMLKDEGGNLSLSDKIFNEEKFSDFLIRPLLDQSIVISNVHFDHCSTVDGVCSIKKGVELKQVIFTEFQCGDVLHISAEAYLENVKIQGSGFPKMLWVRPQDESGKTNPSINGPDIYLDIGDYKGEVSITGLPADKVLMDYQNHVVVRSNLLERVDWKALGISALSYWKLMAKKVKADKSTEGIFSLPSRKSRNYEKSLEELKVLRSAGYID